MEFQVLLQKAVEIREQYAEFEQRNCGRPWTKEEVVMGFVGDMGDLVKLAMAESGIRPIPDSREKLAHELSDCLWSVLVLSHLYEIDLEQAFLQTVDELAQHLTPLED